MNQPEQALHIAVANFLRLALRDDECLWWHVPNGGARTKAAAGRLKAMGTRAGVPDLCFVLPDGRAGFIELKAGKGRVSDSQDDFMLACDHIGAPTAVARSVEQVEGILSLWRVPLHASVLPTGAIQKECRDAT